MNNRQERLYFFLVVWFTMISFLSGWGQNISVAKPKLDFLGLPHPGDPIAHLYTNWAVSRYEIAYLPGNSNAEQQDVSAPVNQNPFNGFSLNMDGSYIQPPNIYYVQSGFFCKREWEFEKATHIPFRFRLGSLAECNAMEGKH